ncbi:hypothetical protein L6164_004312 [Bauhinia variegata]|uniref:Uncharacterized protein n=1 Tax=Bauhinia variegata TaxID=167791 RepID=A0ACB9Q419_BAUVA|nr:hypothetical protein L6164_004312 [Bauhinia variegata]
MKGGNDEGKEISPMFPRLHIKDAGKGGPKAPPRNKMALYEQFSKPSQSFASGSASLFPLPSRNNCQFPSESGHIGGRQSIQFCTSTAPSFLDEKIHAYSSREVNFNKLKPDDLFNCKYSQQKFDGKDDFIAPDSSHGRKSCCSIGQNNEDEEKLAQHKSSYSLKSQNSLRKTVYSTGSIELKLAHYGKNQKEEHSEVSQINQKPEEGSSHPLAGLVDITDASSIEGGNAHTQKENAALGDKINHRDGYLEKMAVSDVNKHPDGLEIGSKCYQVKRGRHKDVDTHRRCDGSNKPISDSILAKGFFPDDVLGVIGEKQFWKARTTIINQQRIFHVQVFELHRLIEVQRSFAGSPHLLLKDKLLLRKPSVSALNKLQSDSVTERPSSIVKPNGKSEKPTTSKLAEENAAVKIPLPCVSNSMSKGLVNQMSNNSHHSASPQIAPAAISSKRSSYCIYPPPGNQWLVPVMSPSEGLVYKPIIGSCPPNVGFMGPYGAYGPVSLSSGSKDVSDSAHVVLASHEGLGVLSGTPLPQFFPPLVPPLMNPSISGSAIEHMTPLTKMLPNDHEDHPSTGEVDSAILNQSSCNVSSPTSKVMSTEVKHFQSSEVLRSTASSPTKRMKGEVLPLFPVAPTFWPPASADRNTQVIDQPPRVIKALPHNPRIATESAARIFRFKQTYHQPHPHIGRKRRTAPVIVLKTQPSQARAALIDT